MRWRVSSKLICANAVYDASIVRATGLIGAHAGYHMNLILRGTQSKAVELSLCNLKQDIYM